MYYKIALTLAKALESIDLTKAGADGIISVKNEIEFSGVSKTAIEIKTDIFSFVKSIFSFDFESSEITIDAIEGESIAKQTRRLIISSESWIFVKGFVNR